MCIQLSSALKGININVSVWRATAVDQSAVWRHGCWGSSDSWIKRPGEQIPECSQTYIYSSSASLNVHFLPVSSVFCDWHLTHVTVCIVQRIQLCLYLYYQLKYQTLQNVICNYDLIQLSSAVLKSAKVVMDSITLHTHVINQFLWRPLQEPRLRIFPFVVHATCEAKYPPIGASDPNISLWGHIFTSWFVHEEWKLTVYSICQDTYCTIKLARCILDFLFLIYQTRHELFLCVDCNCQWLCSVFVTSLNDQLTTFCEGWREILLFLSKLQNISCCGRCKLNTGWHFKGWAKPWAGVWVFVPVLHVRRFIHRKS